MELQHITNPTPAKSMGELRDKIAEWEDAMARHTMRTGMPVAEDGIPRSILLNQLVPVKMQKEVKIH